ncbi:hypothetical protein NQ318_019562 [Aromia moschata]|uniref:C2H2-type domain-containing protein n=1 Tax=Aromia moschata TaxID=1265417 RepID=A0AAV8Z4B2_9CUCU|nr:hypothetical protein NQ318_019562 [Aromia moschata]
MLSFCTISNLGAFQSPRAPAMPSPDDDTASKDSSTREGTPILVTPKIETDDVPFAATDLASKRKLVTCKVCGKEFTTRKGLRYHKRLHTGDMFKCKHCSRQYTRLNHLQRHEESHRKRKVHVCKICGKTLKRMEHLRRHLVTHLAVKPFACNTCNRSFSRVEHLQHHAPRCKGHIVFHCDICNQPFKHEDTMSLHKQTHDGQEKNQLTIENLDNIDEYYYQMEQDDTYTFSDYSDVDDGVDSPFPDSSDMGSCLEPQVEVAEHTDTEQRKEVASDDSQALEKVDREVEVKVESNVSDNNNKNEGTSSNANQVTSDASGSHGTMSHYLPGRFALLQRKHDRIGRGHNSSQVDVTATSKGRYFPSREDPVKQEECVEFPCPACRAIFPAVGQLATHAREKHEELTVYKRRVMGDNRYKCTVCYKGFPTEMYLNVHMYYHNGCTMCEETFPNKALLTEHVKFHKKSIKKALCTECGRGFVRNDYLVQHMRRHRGEKPFKCQYCGKGFPRKTDLTVHERYHTRETTHLCSVCGKAFQRSANREQSKARCRACQFIRKTLSE